MKNNLSYASSWFYDKYFVDNNHITSLEEVEFEGETYPVFARKVSVAYRDMGHDLEATSNHFFIEVDVLGVKIPVDLNQIVTKNKRIKATKFTVAAS